MSDAGDVLANLAPGVPKDGEGAPDGRTFAEVVDGVDDRGDTLPAKAEPEPVAGQEEIPAIQIPKARLDEVLSQNRVLQEQIDKQNELILAQTQLQNSQLQQTQSDEPEGRAPVDYAKAEQDYVNLTLEGDAEAAARLRVFIDENRQADMLASVQATQPEQSDAGAIQQFTYDANKVVEQLAVAHPETDPTNAAYDQNRVDEIHSLRDALDGTGEYTPAESLQRAADLILGAAKSTEAPRTDIKAKVDAANQQAPAMGSTGTPNKTERTIDGENITQKQFDALTEEEIAKFRGDYLTEGA